jgi:hypothetical protein
MTEVHESSHEDHAEEARRRREEEARRKEQEEQQKRAAEQAKAAELAKKTSWALDPKNPQGAQDVEKLMSEVEQLSPEGQKAYFDAVASRNDVDTAAVQRARDAGMDSRQVVQKLAEDAFPPGSEKRVQLGEAIARASGCFTPGMDPARLESIATEALSELGTAPATSPSARRQLAGADTFETASTGGAFASTQSPAAVAAANGRTYTPTELMDSSSSTLATEVIGDATANCLEKAYGLAGPGDSVLLCRDTQDAIGHAVVLHADGTVTDPNEATRFASVSEWSAATGGKYQPVQQVGRDALDEVFRTAPGAERNQLIADLGLGEAARVAVADAPFPTQGPFDLAALRSVAPAETQAFIQNPSEETLAALVNKVAGARAGELATAVEADLSTLTQASAWPDFTMKAAEYDALGSFIGVAADFREVLAKVRAEPAFVASINEALAGAQPPIAPPVTFTKDTPPAEELLRHPQLDRILGLMDESIESIGIVGADAANMMGDMAAKLRGMMGGIDVVDLAAAEDLAAFQMGQLTREHPALVAMMAPGSSFDVKDLLPPGQSFSVRFDGSGVPASFRLEAPFHDPADWSNFQTHVLHQLQQNAGAFLQPARAAVDQLKQSALDWSGADPASLQELTLVTPDVLNALQGEVARLGGIHTEQGWRVPPQAEGLAKALSVGNALFETSLQQVAARDRAALWTGLGAGAVGLVCLGASVFGGATAAPGMIALGMASTALGIGATAVSTYDMYSDWQEAGLNSIYMPVNQAVAPTALDVALLGVDAFLGALDVATIPASVRASKLFKQGEELADAMKAAGVGLDEARQLVRQAQTPRQLATLETVVQTVDPRVLNGLSAPAMKTLLSVPPESAADVAAQLAKLGRSPRAIDDVLRGIPPSAALSANEIQAAHDLGLALRRGLQPTARELEAVQKAVEKAVAQGLSPESVRIVSGDRVLTFKSADAAAYANASSVGGLNLPDPTYGGSLAARNANVIGHVQVNGIDTTYVSFARPAAAGSTAPTTAPYVSPYDVAAEQEGMLRQIYGSGVAPEAVPSVEIAETRLVGFERFQELAVSRLPPGISQAEQMAIYQSENWGELVLPGEKAILVQLTDGPPFASGLTPEMQEAVAVGVKRFTEATEIEIGSMGFRSVAPGSSFWHTVGGADGGPAYASKLVGASNLYLGDAPEGLEKEAKAIWAQERTHEIVSDLGLGGQQLPDGTVVAQLEFGAAKWVSFPSFPESGLAQLPPPASVVSTEISATKVVLPGGETHYFLPGEKIKLSNVKPGTVPEGSVVAEAVPVSLERMTWKDGSVGFQTPDGTVHVFRKIVSDLDTAYVVRPNGVPLSNSEVVLLGEFINEAYRESGGVITLFNHGHDVSGVNVPFVEQKYNLRAGYADSAVYNVAPDGSYLGETRWAETIAALPPPPNPAEAERMVQMSIDLADQGYTPEQIWQRQLEEFGPQHLEKPEEMPGAAEAPSRYDLRGLHENRWENGTPLPPEVLAEMRADLSQPSTPPDPNRVAQGHVKIRPNMDPTNAENLLKQERAGNYLAAGGYDVVHEPNVAGTLKNPDYLVEGKVFDCYAPATSDPDKIWWGVKDKVAAGQADRIVLSLEGNEGADLASLKSTFDNYPMKGLKELMVVTPEGGVAHLWP